MYDKGKILIRTKASHGSTRMGNNKVQEVNFR